jgi:hypothetical protein
VAGSRREVARTVQNPIKASDSYTPFGSAPVPMRSPAIAMNTKCAAIASAVAPLVYFVSTSALF